MRCQRISHRPITENNDKHVSVNKLSFTIGRNDSWPAEGNAQNSETVMAPLDAAITTVL